MADKTVKEVAGEAKAISIELIKKLKELSGVGLTDAKKALVEAKGDFDKAFADCVLMNQPYIFDDKKTVADLIKETIAKTGENINVKQFKRIELGVTE